MSNPLNEEMTRVIVEAFDEAQAEDARARGEEPEDSSGVTEPVDTLDAGEVRDEVTSDEDIEDEEAEEEEEVSAEPGEEEEEDEGESSEEEQAEEVEAEDEPVAFSSDDPAIQAFLARHGGVEEALRDAVERERLLGRQARELGQLREHASKLEAALEQATLFSDNGLLAPEQQEWVTEAAESENPMAYIQHAVAAQEFGLARAVLDQAQIPAGQAVRLSQIIDRAEQLAVPAQEEEVEPLSHQTLLNVLGQRFPEMPQYEQEMIQTLHALGPEHPLYVMAHSQDVAQAAQGIIGLYEIARAKTATVSSARERAKKVSRQSADAAREAAVVTSGGASPPAAKVARTEMVMPGLSREALDAELDRVST